MTARLGNDLYWLGIIIAVLCLLAAGSWIVITDKNRDDARNAFSIAKLATGLADIAQKTDEAESNAPFAHVKIIEQDAASVLATIETAERRYREAFWIAAGLALFGFFVYVVGWTARKSCGAKMNTPSLLTMLAEIGGGPIAWGRDD